MPDIEPDAEPDESTAEQAEEPSRHIDRFRRTGAGTVIAAGMLGLRDALEGRPEREEPAIVADAPSEPHDGLELFLDPDDPGRSRVVIRKPKPE